MTKTQKGQRDTISCTGSARRDSTTAQNNKPSSSLEEEQEIQLTQEEIFQILTNGGEIEGLFMKDGQLYINASYIVAGKLSSKDGMTVFDLDDSRIVTRFYVYSEYDDNFQPVGSPIGETIVRYKGNHLNCTYLDYSTGTEELRSEISFGETGYIHLTTYGDDGSISLDADSAIHIGNNVCYLGLMGNPVRISGHKVDIYGEALTINGMTCAWKSNGDGTYTMIGTPVTT